MQTLKEEWIKIYLLNNNSMLDVVFCATKDYLSSCDNNEPNSAMVAHQNQAHHTLDLPITSTCKWGWAISTQKNPSKTTFHLIYGTLSMLGFDPTW
jgi:hypothetical protein